MSSTPRYVSETHITRSAGPDRVATLPAGESVTFGVHGAIARHYGIDIPESNAHAATLDYVVAATAAAMVGTFARTLKDEGISLGEGDLQADARGVFRAEDRELVLSEIDVSYTLRLSSRVDAGHLRRAHERHVAMCPLVKTLGNCIDIRTSYALTGGSL